MNIKYFKVVLIRYFYRLFIMHPCFLFTKNKLGFCCMGLAVYLKLSIINSTVRLDLRPHKSTNKLLSTLLNIFNNVLSALTLNGIIILNAILTISSAEWTTKCHIKSWIMTDKILILLENSQNICTTLIKAGYSFQRLPQSVPVTLHFVSALSLFFFTFLLIIKLFNLLTLK